MRNIFFIGAMLCVSLSTQGQEFFKGMVADSATFSPLPYVTVKVKNRNIGTATDIRGNFSLEATQRDTLVLSLVGYKTVEQPLLGWEPSIILMAEHATMLKAITIRDFALENPYEGMFDEQNEKLRKLTKSIPFYYSKARKEKIKVQRLENENLRVKTYIDVVIVNTEVKENLMKKYGLTEDGYYDLLARFNAANYSVMYYLTAGELVTLINNFFERYAK